MWLGCYWVWIGVMVFVLCSRLWLIWLVVLIVVRCVCIICLL